MIRAIAAAVVGTILLAGCATGPSRSDAGTTTTTRRIVHGSLSGPTTGRPLTATDPLRVTLVGDSVLYDAAPAIAADLASTGVVRTMDRTTPGFNFGHGLTIAAATLDWRALVRDMMKETDPEVIITSFGSVDSSGISRGLQTPQDFADSLREALTMMTAGSTKVIMLGILPSVEDAGRPNVRPMNRDANPIMEHLTAEFAGKVEYYDTELLLSPEGRAVYSVDGRRVRKLDLIHICPDGAALIAEAIHSTLALSWPVPAAASDWRAGPWRTAARYDDPPGACVATHPGLGG